MNIKMTARELNLVLLAAHSGLHHPVAWVWWDTRQEARATLVACLLRLDEEHMLEMEAVLEELNEQ